MKVLVTGASGFVGGHLAPRLIDSGHDIVCAVRNVDQYEAPPNAEVMELDLARPLDLRKLPHVDAVVHLAQANVRFPDEARELYRVNTVSTQELLDYARRVHAQAFVYASSASVYGFGDHPFAESDPLAGHDFYAVTKMSAEQVVSTYRDFFATAVLRLVVPYGPGQQGRMIPSLIARVRDGVPVALNGGGRPRMNPIYVDDLVRTVLLLLERRDDVVLNVAGDEAVSMRELAELIGNALRQRVLFEEGSAEAPGDIVADTTRLHELHDLRPLVPLAEGLRRTVDAALGAPAS